MRPTKILITGANGQVGTALAAALRDKYGDDKVLCTDIRKPKIEHGLFEMLDILNVQRMAEVIEDSSHYSGISSRRHTQREWRMESKKNMECQSEWPAKYT
jgi:nucleoside-diphosphate-sugar epimerase